MSDNVLWIDDVVKLKLNAITADGKMIDNRFKGNSYNWIVTNYDAQTEIVTLGSFSAFGAVFPKNPPIVVHRNFVEPDSNRLACRHPEAHIEMLPYVLPTCTSKGQTRGSRCGVCGKILKEQTILPEVGHMYVNDSELGKRVCLLCKHEEPIQRKNLELKKSDIQAMIKIIENMLGDPSETKIPQDFTGKMWDKDHTHEYIKDTYSSIEYILLKSSVLDLDSTSPYKLPLIVWFGNDNMDSNATTTQPSFWANGTNMSASHVLIPKFSGNFMAYKNEFFNLLEQLISKYYIDDSRIVLIGDGLGGAAVQFFMYQDPNKFSYQVIIDGTSTSIDFNSIKDIGYKTKLYSSSISEHMNFLSSLFNIVPEQCNSTADALSTIKLISESVLVPILEAQNISTLYEAGIYSVKDTSVTLKSSPSTYAEDADNKIVFRGQRLPIIDFENAQNYTWGKLDSTIWETDDSALWIPLENMFLDGDGISTTEYVVPCQFTSYGMKFTTFIKNYVRIRHNGIDLVTDVGTPVFACQGGEVIDIQKSTDYGTTIRISNDLSTDTYIEYSHLQDVQIQLGEGVSAGTLIGYVCDSSTSSVTPKPHLHVGIMDKGIWINPEERIDFYK